LGALSGGESGLIARERISVQIKPVRGSTNLHFLPQIAGTVYNRQFAW